MIIPSPHRHPTKTEPIHMRKTIITALTLALSFGVAACDKKDEKKDEKKADAPKK